MDEWVTALKGKRNRTTSRSAARSAKRSRTIWSTPASRNNGTVKIAETQVYKGATQCNALYPAFSTPRMVAGEPLANDVLKCHLKRVDPWEYRVRFHARPKKRS